MGLFKGTVTPLAKTHWPGRPKHVWLTQEQNECFTWFKSGNPWDMEPSLLNLTTWQGKNHLSVFYSLNVLDNFKPGLCNDSVVVTKTLRLDTPDINYAFRLHAERIEFKTDNGGRPARIKEHADRQAR